MYDGSTFLGATFDGDLTNHGLLDISVVGTHPYVTVTGAFTQSSSGTLKMALASSSTYTQLNIAGLATLAGTLTVLSLGGYSPLPGSSFALLTFGSYSGTFDTVTFPALGFGVWHQTYNSGSYVGWVSYC